MSENLEPLSEREEFILAEIEKASNLGLTVAELAEKFEISYHTVYREVKNLERRGRVMTMPFRRKRNVVYIAREPGVGSPMIISASGERVTIHDFVQSAVATNLSDSPSIRLMGAMISGSILALYKQAVNHDRGDIVDKDEIATARRNLLKVRDVNTKINIMISSLLDASDIWESVESMTKALMHDRNYPLLETDIYKWENDYKRTFNVN